MFRTYDDWKCTEPEEIADEREEMTPEDAYVIGWNEALGFTDHSIDIPDALMDDYYEGRANALELKEFSSYLSIEERK